MRDTICIRTDNQHCAWCKKRADELMAVAVVTRELIQDDRPEGLMFFFCGNCALRYGKLEDIAYNAHRSIQRLGVDRVGMERIS